MTAPNSLESAPARSRRAYLHVFGCQMNKLDAELVRACLAVRGYEFADAPENAGLILFITCSVREHAEERVHARLGALRRLKSETPDVVVGLLGCMAQEHGAALFKKHPHLDIVCGTSDFHLIPELVERARAGERAILAVAGRESAGVERNPALRPSRHSAFVSAMRGCDQYCAYCIVPYVRGREASRPMEEIVREASALLADGVTEITLLGQAVNRYRDGGGRRLPDLLRRLDALPGLKRLHFVTSFPSHVDGALIDAVAECRTVSRFLHVPAQSGSDRMLERMERGYTAADYRVMAARLRRAVPDMELGSDFIVGFPGESDADFEATAGLLQDIRFQQSFIFKYSPRPGTAAARRYKDDVPLDVKKQRNQGLLRLQEKISLEKNAAMVGREVEVLVEGRSRRDRSRCMGRTIYNQIVAFPSGADLAGRLVRVRIGGFTALTLIGDRFTEDAP